MNAQSQTTFEMYAQPTTTGDDPATLPATDTDNEIAREARSRQMVVVPECDDANRATGTYTVAMDGQTEIVSLDDPECSCGADDCLHLRRVVLEINDAGCPTPGNPVAPYFNRRISEIKSRLSNTERGSQNLYDTAEAALEAFDE